MRNLILISVVVLFAVPAQAAYFAQLDQNNIVTQVVVIADADAKTEAAGIAFCQKLFNGGNYIQTDLTGSRRKHYAGIGYVYNSGLDAFVPPKPFESWVLDTETIEWIAPVPMPDDGQRWSWNEAGMNWELAQ